MHIYKARSPYLHKEREGSWEDGWRCQEGSGREAGTKQQERGTRRLYSPVAIFNLFFILFLWSHACVTVEVHDANVWTKPRGRARPLIGFPPLHDKAEG